MKHINFTFLLTILMSMVGTLSSAHDIAVKNADGKTIYYNYANNQTELSVTYRGSNYSSSSYSGIINIPKSVKYNGTTYPVTSIGDNAFRECSDLTSVTIPNSVTSIGSYAFDYCRGLTSIEIPNSVTSIGDDAFHNCSGLTSVTIPNSVTSIGDGAFYGCSNLITITVAGDNPIYDSRDNCNAIIETTSNTLVCGCPSTIIPNSVTSIGSYAFSGCSGLTSVTIPNSVTSIGSFAFWYCSGLTSIEIPNSVTSIDVYAFYNCSGLTSIEIPNSVTSISSSAFSFCSGLTSVTIPNSVTSIGSYAFQGCYSLTSIEIPNSVTSIGSYAFGDCSNLTSVKIPNSVTSIGGYAFNHTAWYNNQPDGMVYAGKVAYKYKGTMPDNTSIIIREGTSAITEMCFSYCSGLTSIEIPNSVTSIGDGAFSYCSSLPSIFIPKATTMIGDYVFRGCASLKEVVMEDRDDDTVLALGSNGLYPLFDDCPLDSVYIGRNISYGKTSSKVYSPFYRNTSLRSVVITDRETEISENEFYGCTNLKNVSIGDGVTTIGNCAFSGCAALDNFSFGSSMETIGKEAFSDCTAMTKLVSRSATPPVCNTNALDDINKRNCTLTIPQGTLAQYQAADQWKEFFFIEEKDLSSVNNITMDDGSKQEIVATYDLNGRKTTGLQRGMNIVKMKNGDTRKVVIK